MTPEQTHQVRTSFEMTPEQIHQVRTSFEMLSLQGDEIARCFYARLFEQHPELRALFSTDTEAQRRKLFAAILTVVNSLDNPKGLRPMLSALGRRHLRYQAYAPHYALFNDIFIQVLGQASGASWSSGHERAWRAALELVEEAMVAGQQEATT